MSALHIKTGCAGHVRISILTGERALNTERCEPCALLCADVLPPCATVRYAPVSGLNSECRHRVILAIPNSSEYPYAVVQLTSNVGGEA